MAAINPDMLDKQVRSLKPLSGISTPKISGPANFFSMVVTLLAFLWQVRDDGHTDPRLARAGYVHLDASDISKVDSFPAGETIAFATHTDDAFAVKVTMPPSLPDIVEGHCGGQDECRQDENMLYCEECDGFNKTCRAVSTRRKIALVLFARHANGISQRVNANTVNVLISLTKSTIITIPWHLGSHFP